MLLEISDLRLTFERQGDPIEVLHGVGLNVAPGELVALVGESGSGKSTTVRAALRLYGNEATLDGSIKINGSEMIGADPGAVRGVRASQVGFVQQDPRAALNPVRRIGDSLSERLVRVHGWTKQRALTRVIELLHSVGLSQPEDRVRQFPHELSGGMLQRVVIAGAISTDPQLILADEATSALDVTTQAEVLAIFQRQIRERGLGMLLITHDLHLAAAVCDRIYVLRQGEVIEMLSKPGLFADATHPYTRTLIETAPTMDRKEQV